MYAKMANMAQEDRLMYLATLPEELNTATVCEVLSLNRNTVHAWAKNGKLKPIGPRVEARDRQRLRFRRDDILAMLSADERADVEALRPTE